jgi:hypothetical protein
MFCTKLFPKRLSFSKTIVILSEAKICFQNQLSFPAKQRSEESAPKTIVILSEAKNLLFPRATIRRKRPIRRAPNQSIEVVVQPV